MLFVAFRCFSLFLVAFRCLFVSAQGSLKATALLPVAFRCFSLLSFGFLCFSLLFFAFPCFSSHPYREAPLERGWYRRAIIFTRCHVHSGLSLSLRRFFQYQGHRLDLFETQPLRPLDPFPGAGVSTYAVLSRPRARVWGISTRAMRSILILGRDDSAPRCMLILGRDTHHKAAAVARRMRLAHLACGART